MHRRRGAVALLLLLVARARPARENSAALEHLYSLTSAGEPSVGRAKLSDCVLLNKDDVTCR